MEKQLKDAIDRSIAELKRMQEKVEDRFEDLIEDPPENLADVQNRSRDALSGIGELLNKAAKQAGESAEEAQLQAHLGLMEAQDKLESARPVLDDYVSRVSKESKTLLDEMELKAHLARMEATDFWETRGKGIAEEFKASASEMQKLAERAIGDLQTQFGDWNDRFRDKS